MPSIRHAVLTTQGGTPEQTVHIRREYADGSTPRFVMWCGREHGWAFTGDRYAPDPKDYATPALAKKALTAILRHENALGLDRRINRRY